MPPQPPAARAHLRRAVAAAGAAGLALMAAAAPAAAATLRPEDGEVAPTGSLLRTADLSSPSIVQVEYEVTATLVDGGTSTQHDLQWMGTGFLVSSDGYIVTAGHVAAPTDTEIHTMLVDDAIDADHHCVKKTDEDCAAVEQQYEPSYLARTTVTGVTRAMQVLLQTMRVTDSGYDATLVDSSPSTVKDLALIKVDLHDQPSLPVGDSTSYTDGSPLVVIGYPASVTARSTVSNALIPTESAGTIVSHTRALEGDTIATDADLLRVSSHLEHGDSGGPAIGSDGKVYGVVSHGDPNGVDAQFLVASDEVQRILADNHVDTTPGQADRDWRDGYAALAAGDTATAHRDFAACLQLDPQQIGCSTDLDASQPVHVAPPSMGSSPGGIASPDTRGTVLGYVAAAVVIELFAGLCLSLGARQETRRRERWAAMYGGVDPWTAAAAAWPRPAYAPQPVPQQVYAAYPAAAPQQQWAPPPWPRSDRAA